MVNTEVFFLPQVAKILKMPESLIKNWSIGRGLRIVPHRRAVGSGSRNLYSMHDLYRFSIAHRLSIDGFAPRAIQSILDGLGADFTSSPFAVVTNAAAAGKPSRRTFQVQLLSESLDRENWTVIEGAIRSSFGCHVLYVSGITADVNHRAERFLQKTFGHQPPAQHDSDQLAGGDTGQPTRKFRKLR